MATLAPLSSPPMRQSFGSLDGSRLRNLTNVKNRQNALPITLSSPVKHRYSPSTFDDDDSENIDPSVFSSPTKKSKSFDGTPIKPIKGSQFVLTNVSPAPSTFDAHMYLVHGWELRNIDHTQRVTELQRTSSKVVIRSMGYL